MAVAIEMFQETHTYTKTSIPVDLCLQGHLTAKGLIEPKLWSFLKLKQVGVLTISGIKVFLTGSPEGERLLRGGASSEVPKWRRSSFLFVFGYLESRCTSPEPSPPLSNEHLPVPKQGTASRSTSADKGWLKSTKGMPGVLWQYLICSWQTEGTAQNNEEHRS